MECARFPACLRPATDPPRPALDKGVRARAVGGDGICGAPPPRHPPAHAHRTARCWNRRPAGMGRRAARPLGHRKRVNAPRTALRFSAARRAAGCGGRRQTRGARALWRRLPSRADGVRTAVQADRAAALCAHAGIAARGAPSAARRGAAAWAARASPSAAHGARTARNAAGAAAGRGGGAGGGQKRTCAGRGRRERGGGAQRQRWPHRRAAADGVWRPEAQRPARQRPSLRMAGPRGAHTTTLRRWQGLRTPGGSRRCGKRPDSDLGRPAPPVAWGLRRVRRPMCW